MVSSKRTWTVPPRKTAGISAGRAVLDPVRESQQRGAVDSLELLDVLFDYAPKKEIPS